MSASPDQLLVTPTEDQKGSSVVFEVPASELKKNYKFRSDENSSAGNTFCVIYYFSYKNINCTENIVALSCVS